MANGSEKFEFSFNETPNQVIDEFDEDTVDYEDEPAEEDDPAEFEDKSLVLIFTRNHQVYGKIALVPGARLTDYIIGAQQFIAVTEAEIRDRTGKVLLTTSFLDINRDQIEIILPADLATINNAAS